MSAPNLVLKIVFKQYSLELKINLVFRLLEYHIKVLVKYELNMLKIKIQYEKYDVCWLK